MPGQWVKRGVGFIACILLLLCSFPCSAQNEVTVSDSLQHDSIPLMGEYCADIVAIRHPLERGLKIAPIGFSLQGGSLDQFLTQHSSIFIKSYGTGLATPSFRGTGAEHTKVYWNGLSLVSPMLGQFDLNLMPLFIIDAGDISYGNASLKTGSGGFGGSIQLQSEVRPEDSGYVAEAMMDVGSFGAHRNGLMLNFNRRDSFYGSTRIYTQSAENDYPYINTTKYGSPTDTLHHAESRQFGIMQQAGVRLKGPDRRLEGTIWYQQTYRNLPNLMTSPGGSEDQFDESTRVSLQYRDRLRYNYRYYTYLLSGMYSGEYLLYQDTLTHINSKSHFDRYQLSAKLFNEGYPVHDWNFSAQITASHDRGVSSDGYTHPEHQDRVSALLYWNYESNRKLWGSIMFRPEVVNNTLLLNGTAGICYALIEETDSSRNRLDYTLNAGHNENYPTLNDLYWNPGGNPGLKPEEGYVAETGLSFDLSKKKYSLSGSATVFSNLINHYILWQPSSLGYWTAQNITQVWARGLELNANYSFSIYKGLYMSINGVYTYTRSSNQKASSPQDNTVGKQLIYIPENMLKGSINIGYKRIGLSLNDQYTGMRYTPDASLPAYNLLNTSISYYRHSRVLNYTIELKCNNLLNTSYQAIAYRPMPGRWFEGGLKIYIYGNKKPDDSPYDYQRFN